MRAPLSRPDSPEPAGGRLPPDEAAIYCGTKRRFLMDAARRGEIPCIVYRRGRDGRATVIAFERRDLDAFVAAHRQEASPTVARTRKVAR